MKFTYRHQLCAYCSPLSLFVITLPDVHRTADQKEDVATHISACLSTLKPCPHKRKIYLVFPFPIKLRYYATFKVRKFESSFYEINTFLQKTTTCIELQAEQIFSLIIQYIYFFNFGRDFCGSFSMFIQKLQHLVIKKIEIIFTVLYFYLYKLKKYVSDF